MKAKGQAISSLKKPEKEFKQGFDRSNDGSEHSEQKNIKWSGNVESTVDRDHEKSHSLAAEDSSHPVLPREVIFHFLFWPIYFVAGYLKFRPNLYFLILIFGFAC